MDTHIHNIKQLGPETIKTMVDGAIGRTVHEAKKNLEFGRRADVAIDMTYVAYYGDRDEIEMVSGTPAALLGRCAPCSACVVRRRRASGPFDSHPASVGPRGRHW